MSNHDNIQAPGRSALWTEAALRALTGLLAGGAAEWGDGALARRSHTIATAFERECEETWEEEQEADRARVRAIGRFRFIGDNHTRTVATVEGDDVTFVQIAGEVRPRTTTVEHVLDPSCYEPAPLDASAPTAAGGEERA